MTDIVERLRKVAWATYRGEGEWKLADEAADEIERLREALRAIAEWAAADPHTAGEIARLALGPVANKRNENETQR